MSNVLTRKSLGRHLLSNESRNQERKKYKEYQRQINSGKEILVAQEIQKATGFV